MNHLSPRRGKIAIASMTLIVCGGLIAAQDNGKKTTNPTTPPANGTAQPAATDLPPGMTQEDMKAMMEAAQPGPMHEWLCADAGTWIGQCKMWMAPGMEPNVSTATLVQTPLLGGRFVEQRASGDMGEWGLFEGFGLIGYDNAKGEFQNTWADSMGTGMMHGTGTLSADKKVLTINSSYFCPMQKKVCSFRQTTTRNDDGTRTQEMWGVAPGSTEEHRMMEIIYKKAPAATRQAAR